MGEVPVMLMGRVLAMRMTEKAKVTLTGEVPVMRMGKLESSRCLLEIRLT